MTCIGCGIVHNSDCPELRIQTSIAADHLIWRRLLWLRHGCPREYLYGDDGEMQCANCVIDFRRALVQEIEAIYASCDLEAYARATGQTIQTIRLYRHNPNLPPSRDAIPLESGEDYADYAHGAGDMEPIRRAFAASSSGGEDVRPPVRIECRCLARRYSNGSVPCVCPGA